jgi:hypothetical protein
MSHRKMYFTTIHFDQGDPSKWYIRTRCGGYYCVTIFLNNPRADDTDYYVSPGNRELGVRLAKQFTSFKIEDMKKLSKKETCQLLLQA